MAAGMNLRKKPETGKSRRRAPVKERAPKKRSSKGATRNAPVAKEPGRRPAVWLNRLLVLLGTGVVVAAVVQSYIKVQSIPVQQILVKGDLVYTMPEELQEMVQPALAGGFLNADLQHMREQLEALPWVYEATVRRRWPNALEIQVVEELPIARWGDAGFLNHEGEIFLPAEVAGWQDLPVLQGPEGSARSLMASYQRVIEILGPLGLTVERLVVDNRSQLEAVLDTGMTLVFGGDAFRERMQRFVTLYQRDLAPRLADVERVDLRYESGVAVTFNEPPAVAETDNESKT